jgi:hypothetical protein
MSDKESVFERLSKIDISKIVEKKKRMINLVIYHGRMHGKLCHLSLILMIIKW